MAAESEQCRALAERFRVICPPGAGSPGVRVSCGHSVNAAGLRDWVRALLGQGVIFFRCPSCPDAPWLWQELCKLVLFSDKEQATLEARILAKEEARGSYRQCPRCQKLIQRLDSKTLRTTCLHCSQRTGGLYCFCWGCRREWLSLSPQSNSCSNPQCSLQAVLHDAPEIQDPEFTVCGCPSLRACPSCHALVSHNGKGCPEVQCPQCLMMFCYRCLTDHRLWKEACIIAGRQELNGPPQPKGDPRLTPAFTPENPLSVFRNQYLAPSSSAPSLVLGTSRGMTPRPSPRDGGSQCTLF